MNPQKQEITLFDAVTPVAVTSSTDATPVVVTATAHNLNTGDRVLIFGHTTNVAANGIFKVTVVTSSTFNLLDEFTGVSVAGSGAGGGTGGVMVKAPPVLLVSDFRNTILQVGTSGTATMTLKVAGSVGKPASSYANGPRYDYPNIGATVSPSNPYTFLQLINLDTAAAINGATGIVVGGADINNQYEVNINAMKYLTVIPITWSAGVITVKALLNTAI
jgi:hypothetical protein